MIPRQCKGDVYRMTMVRPWFPKETYAVRLWYGLWIMIVTWYGRSNWDDDSRRPSLWFQARRVQ